MRFFVGGILGWWVQKRYPEVVGGVYVPRGISRIAGESLMGVVLVVWDNAPALVRKLLGQ